MPFTITFAVEINIQRFRSCQFRADGRPEGTAENLATETFGSEAGLAGVTQAAVQRGHAQIQLTQMQTVITDICLNADVGPSTASAQMLTQ